MPIPPVLKVQLPVVALLFAACNGGDSLLLPSEGEPATIEVVHGDRQSGLVGEPLTEPLVVQVTDSRSRPVEGATVAFELTPPSNGAEISPGTAITDANGQAQAQIVLGTSIGPQAGRARVVMGTGASAPAATFSVTALSENANRMTAIAGDDQTGRVGSPLGERLVVEVTDAFGNPIAGVPVSWQAVGGGQVSETSNNTDGQGQASVQRVLGPAVGEQSTTASSPGLAGSPVTFVHTALSGDAAHLVIISGDNQTGQVGSVLVAELVVRLVDAEGNGVASTAVAWVVATGGGTASPATSQTDGDGRASTHWRLGDSPGANRLDAVVSGVGVVSFEATATAGTPAALSIRTQPSSSARNGRPFDRQPVIQLRDAQGNEAHVEGIPVAVAIGEGTGDLTGTRVRLTDGNGRAGFTDLAIVGGGRHTLVFSSSGRSSVTSNGIEVGAIPTSTTITSDTPDPSNSGDVVTVAFTVSSEGPTPTGTVTVTALNGGANCSGSLTAGNGSCQLTLNLAGDRTLRAAYAGAPGFDPSAATEGHRVNPSTPQNQAPHADYNWHCDGLTCQFTDASNDPDGTIASWSWNFGDGGTASDQNPTHTFPGAGTYNVTLTVTDNGGATNAASAGVQVTPPPPQTLRLRTQPSSAATVGVVFNRQPEVQLRAGNNDVKTADVVVTASIASGAGSLGGTTSATTDGNGRARFTDLRINGATGAHSLQFAATGYASVNSDAIQVSKASTTTTITSDNPDPSNPNPSDPNHVVTVTFKVDWPSSAGTPTGSVDVTVSGSSSGCNGAIDASGSGNCQLTELSTPGNRTLTATYSGDDLFNGSGSAGERHTINQPPTASFAAPACTAGTDCAFDGSGSSDPDGSIGSYAWDFGDNGTGSGPQPSHNFAAPGPYTVTLTVTDNLGATGSTSQTVNAD